MDILASAIFILGYLAIALESKFKTSKAAMAMFMGGVLWVLVGLVKKEHVAQALVHTASETFSIVIFLLCAMSLVEILVHYKLFDIIRGKLFKLGLKDKQQFLVIGIITFFLSAILDNLTTTIVMIQIAKRFFKKDNLLIAAAGIVIAANAGGAWSPIGDVTTIMLWLAGKFEALEIIIKGILPSLALCIVSLFLLQRQIINEENNDTTNEIVTSLYRSEKLILGVTLLVFSLPLIMNTIFGLPPYFGLLIGLGFIWLMVDIIKQFRPHQTHLEAQIDEMIKRTDLPSLKFFIGILLAVAALNELGILQKLSNVLYGSNPEISRMIIGNIGIGLVSSILDNVPLAALSLQLIKTEIADIWVLLALTLGTGGSLLVIGSAAGVVAMGMVKELNFAKYFKIAFMPALLGYFAGIGVWLLQFYYI